ncbi:MAG: RagB/SusD family nutrient uptake outer membrane protein [Bacteroidota bacterium]
MKIHSLYIILLAFLFVSCEEMEFEENPKAEVSKEPVFNTEDGLQTYAYSFYDVLPSVDDIIRGDGMSDYMASNSRYEYLSDSYGPNRSSGWDWGQLRNVNYFIENNTSEEIDSDVRDHYTGLARFFRAMFYFDKVKRFGDVPWISEVPDVNDDDILYAGRDSRSLVMDSVLADIDFAIENIDRDNDDSKTRITKWVALALKSRIALFEGTFRKYHTDQGLESSADGWLEESVDAAQEIMENSDYQLYTASGPEHSYRELFTSTDPVGEEIMLAHAMSEEEDILHSANWSYTSPTLWIKPSLTRQFIKTYLLQNGERFTDQENYETQIFPEEVADRDYRLKQTIRGRDYTRIDGGAVMPAPPDFGVSLTGYQPIKWVLDDTYYDQRDYNDNAVSIFRYAEVLLNYAEAKAELGTITEEDWENTIGALRSRAGIEQGNEQFPSSADDYLKSTYFPEVDDPIILEIRRERTIELVMEGFRFYDLVRWERGELMEMKWRGIYVPGLDEPMDLNQDGQDDVVFVEEGADASLDGGEVVEVGGETQQLTEETHGELTWLDNVPRIWEDKKYFYPIPEDDILENENLDQNPGW